MTNHLGFDLAAGFMARAEENMPRQIVPGSPIMDDEDAHAQEIAAIWQIADGAIQRAKEQQARADNLHFVVGRVLLALNNPSNLEFARTILENALDAELQPKPDLGPVPF